MGRCWQAGGRWLVPAGRRIPLVIQDRVRLNEEQRERRLEALETAMRLGGGVAHVVPRVDGILAAGHEVPRRLVSAQEPRPGLFSFNSPGRLVRNAAATAA